MDCTPAPAAQQLTLTLDLPGTEPDQPAGPAALHDYDVVLVNSSAGKDSQAMLTHLVALAARENYPLDRFVVVHCDLGRVEWPGTRQLAHDQASFYGLRFEVVRRDLGDLLTQIEQRGKFPSSAARYCTSDHKTSQVLKLMTRLTAEHAHLARPVRILNCLGIRAEESPARAKKPPFAPDKASNSKRHVDRWYPIFDWATDQVWDTIRASGVPHHPIYDAGMTRASCCFCVLASKPDLLRAVHLAPDLAATYAHVETAIGHDFKHGLPMRDLIAQARPHEQAA